MPYVRELIIPPSFHAYFLKIMQEANDDYKSEQLEILTKKMMKH